MKKTSHSVSKISQLVDDNFMRFFSKNNNHLSNDININNFSKYLKTKWQEKK